ncbi:MAG TPA: BON domain-containing protein [Polyangiaceae bacterium]|nr:BON domain-containing protein [Polyangiaceae bacterium]
MKLSISVWLCAAGAVACSHENRPPSIPMDSTASTEPAPTRRVEPTPLADNAPTNKRAPTLPGLPTNGPTVLPPAPSLAPPPDGQPLTPANGVGSARPVSALVSMDPMRDKAESPQDQESVRDIRALLAADRALAATSPQVTIVVRDGRVWLRGQVNTATQRAAIEKTARKGVWVRDVKNELVVME